MSDRRKVLSEMLDTSLKSFTKVLQESNDLGKLTRHSKMEMNKRELDALMTRMAGATQQKVHEKTSKLINENQICERLDELEKLNEESVKLNEQLGRDDGYQNVKAKHDIALHLHETTNSMLNGADEEIERLEKELAAETEELERRNRVFSELTVIVESQQKKLWDSSSAE